MAVQDERHRKQHQKKLFIRSDHLWTLLIRGESVPNLERLVQCCFSILASNAYCESIFSHMKFLWNDNRNRMTNALVGAELKIKMNSHFTCTEVNNYLLNGSEMLRQIRSVEKYGRIAKVMRTV